MITYLHTNLARRGRCKHNLSHPLFGILGGMEVKVRFQFAHFGGVVDLRLIISLGDGGLRLAQTAIAITRRILLAERLFVNTNIEPPAPRPSPFLYVLTRSRYYALKTK